MELIYIFAEESPHRNRIEPFSPQRRTFGSINMACSFSISISFAAVINYHKLSGLQHHKFFLLRFWKSKVWSQSHWAKVQGGGRADSFWRLWGENRFPLLFNLPVAASIPWLKGLSPPSKHATLISASIGGKWSNKCSLGR